MIHTIRLTMIGAIFSILFLGCTDDTFTDSGGVRTEGSAPIRFTLTIPDAEIIQTRAGTNTDASLVSIDVLLFDNSGSKTDEKTIGLVAHRTIDDLNTTSIELPLSAASRVVYVVANAKNYLKDIPTNDNQMKDGGKYKYSLEQIRNLLVTKQVTPDERGFVTGSDIPDIPLPMSVSVPFGGGLSSNSIINAVLVRMPSKISVTTPLGASNFKIKGLTLCNGAQKGHILAPADPTAPDGRGEGRMAYTKADSTLYAYPTYVGGGESPVSVVVEAQYNGNATSSFYRLLISTDLTAPDKGISLQRNYHYKIKIKRVGIDGESSLEKAISSSPANIEYTVVESDNFPSTTIVSGKSFSLDYEQTIVYADSMESVSLATFRTNYPLADGTPTGTITVDPGLVLHGRTTFTAADTLKNIIVDITPSYSYSVHSDTDPKGIHLSLGGYNKTIEVIRKSSVDIHPIVLELSDISNAKFLLSSGSSDVGWMSFSLSPTYSSYERYSALSVEVLQSSGSKGYLHLDENMNSDYREVYFETISTSSTKTKHFLRQEGIANYQLGFFGGILQSTATISQYSKQLIIEGYEENEESLSVFNAVPTNTQKEALHALFEDGKQSTLALARNYNSPAALYCLNKNRDTNGNGKIDDNEILWYLPGVRQGMGLVLYQALAGNLSNRYWSSSCIYCTGAKNNHIEGVWGLNTIFDSGGYVINISSYSNSVNEKRHIRCVRDL